MSLGVLDFLFALYLIGSISNSIVGVVNNHGWIGLEQQGVNI